VETLKEELIHSNNEAERSSRELESLRTRILQDGANEASREREFIELQGELERHRMERDEFEHALMTERVVSDEAKAELTTKRRELELEREARAKDLEELEREREKSGNLASVLEDFQSSTSLLTTSFVNLTNASGYSKRIRNSTSRTRTGRPVTPDNAVTSRIQKSCLASRGSFLFLFVILYSYPLLPGRVTRVLRKQ